KLAVAGAAALALAFGAIAPTPGYTQDKNPMVGGAAMYANKNIVQNAMNSKNHTTLVAAVKAAGLVETLEGKGPFTVFAPTNEAFGRMPEGTVDMLLKPESKNKLTKVLTYHVVPGKYTKHELEKLIKEHKGKAMLKAASGDMLTFMMNGPQNIQVMDASGGVANIATYDVMQKNG